MYGATGATGATGAREKCILYSNKVVASSN